MLILQYQKGLDVLYQGRVNPFVLVSKSMAALAIQVSQCLLAPSNQLLQSLLVPSNQLLQCLLAPSNQLLQCLPAPSKQPHQCLDPAAHGTGMVALDMLLVICLLV